MRLRYRLALLGAGLAAQAPAVAGITELGPGRFLCEAEAGQNSSQDVAGYFRGGPAAARVTFLAAATGRRNEAAVGGLAFAAGGGRSAHVLVMAASGRRRLFVVVNDPRADHGWPIGRARRGVPVEIGQAMLPPGLRLGGEAVRAHVDAEVAPVPEVAITCSNGRFEIELVRDPQAPPPD